jgi:transposase
MANQLTMALIDTIHTLHQRGWSQRRIALEMGIDRETVGRYLGQAPLPAKPALTPTGSLEAAGESKPAVAPTGAKPIEAGSKPAIALTGSDGDGTAVAPELATVPQPLPRGRPSDCEPFRASILAKLEQGLSAQRIYQDLVTDHGFRSKYHSVRRFVHRLGTTTALPFRRLECQPGEEAQVDFGSGAVIVLPDQKRRRTHVFRIVLSHSRKAYSEAVYRQTTEEFIRCLENAFAHFGGVPKVLVLDNFKAAVTQPDWFDPELNPKLRALATHYGLAILPTKPATPRHKGKIENGVGYVKDNALKGHVFASLEEENHHLLTWETTVADTRIHGTTRQQVGKVFLEVERPALLPLPAERFPFFHESQRSVHRDGHVEVDRAYYSVPPEYLARTVWVRWDSRLVRVFNQQMQQIAVHAKHEPGRFSTQRGHIASQKISGVERGAAWLLDKVRLVGPQSSRWAEAVIAQRGVEGVRVLQGLLSLAKRHRADQIEHACDIALSHDAYHLRTLRQLLARHEASRQETLPFLEEHPLIRPLTDYSQFVHVSCQKEVPS